MNNKILRNTIITPEVGILIPTIIIGIVTGSINPTFFTGRYLGSILNGAVPVGMAALGVAFVIMCGEIDLSTGAVGCFSGIMMSKAALSWGWGPVPCFLLLFFTGAGMGAINGLIVTKVGISSWITTLAMMYICKGLSQTISGGVVQSVESLNVKAFGMARPYGLSYFVFIFVFILVVVDLLMRHTKFGYELRATGGNLEAAEMAGINVKTQKWLAFVLAGFFASMGAGIDVIQMNAGVYTQGDGREFLAIICCAIGGIRLSGGAGSIYGVALGILLLNVLRSSLRLLGVNINILLFYMGLILILAVMLDRFQNYLKLKTLVYGDKK